MGGQYILRHILKNLEVTIRNVHIRYEDGGQDSSGFDFAAGFTLHELKLSTQDLLDGQETFSKVFSKHVVLSGMALYWTPRVRTPYSKVGAALFNSAGFSLYKFRFSI